MGVTTPDTFSRFTLPDRPLEPRPAVSKPLLPSTTAHRLMRSVKLWHGDNPLYATAEPLAAFSTKPFTRDEMICHLEFDSLLRPNAARMHFKRMVDRGILEVFHEAEGDPGQVLYTLYAVSDTTICRLYLEYGFVPAYGTLRECAKVLGPMLLQHDMLFAMIKAQGRIDYEAIVFANRACDDATTLYHSLPDASPTLRRVIIAFEQHIRLTYTLEGKCMADLSADEIKQYAKMIVGA